MRAVRDIANRADMATLRAALHDKDVEAAVLAVNIDNAAFMELRAALLETYAKSGTLTVSGQTWTYPNGQRAVVRWNSITPNAEAYARYVGSTLITNTTADMQAAVRDIVADGYALGRGYDRIALDIVGRVGADGNRAGGIVGLSVPQTQWVANLRRYLNENPRRALEMSLFTDRTYRRMIEKGKPLTQAQIDTIVLAYSASMLKSRGLAIARTEARKAAEMGKYEAWQQALEKTGIPERFVLREWVHTGRAVHDRPDHIVMHGDVKRGLQFPHVMPDGTAMMHPHDTSFGAGAKDVINCRCEEKYYIDKKGLREWRAS